MLSDSKTVEKRKLDIPTIQKYLFCLVLFITPLAIMPFPWDWTERSMSLVILFVATIIISLEIIKLIWEGKSTFLKSILDGGIFAILISLILSTLFSKNLNESIWGVDGRLGAGLIVFVAILLMCLCARTFIKDKKDIEYVLLALIIGFTISNILSVYSFFGANIWSAIPVYKVLGQSGLPLLRYSKIHLFMNFIIVLMNMGFIVRFLIQRESKKTAFTIAIISIIISALNIWVFSINQGIGLIILFILLTIILSIFGIRRLKLPKTIFRNILIYIFIILLFILIPTILLQIPSVRGGILPQSVNLVSQVSLGSDVSWIIAISTLIASFGQGLFGMGVDAYPIAYNLYKPLNVNLLQYNSVNFYYGSNEVFTQLTNGGLIWLLAWGFFGFVIFKMIKRDWEKIKTYNINAGDSWMLVVFDILILYIFLSSIFATYSVLVYLVLLTIIALRSVLLEILSKGTEEKFVIKLWTANLNPENGAGKPSNSFNIIATFIIACIGIAVSSCWVSKAIASVYLLKAESYYIEQNNEYKDKQPTIQERESFMNSMVYYYSTAVKFDNENPLINRKLGSVYLELAGIAANKYSQEGVDDENKALFIKDVEKWRNYALDSTEKGIDINPEEYSNWETRAQVYMGLVGMGFKNYAPDTLYALQRAIELNPLNYNLYYNEAQIYLINGDKDSALSALTKVLSINAQHIPSVMLAANINNENGNIKVYESYLKAAKKILENVGQTDTDVYKQVTEKLAELASKEIVDTTTQNSEDANVKE